MGALLSYSLVSGLFMLVLYLAYRVFLARDNQHGFNRGILLLIYFISFSMPIFMLLSESLRGRSSTALTFGNIEIAAGDVSHESQSIWWTMILLAFCLGMVSVFAKTIFTWLKLTCIIRDGERIRKDGYTLVVTDNEKYAPFSWMRYIVVSRADYENNYSAIVAHELKHVASFHWVDLLVAQAICIVNWFNPAAWLMRDELMLVHEYQADMAVIDKGNNPQEYQMLLIKKAVGARFPSLANSLNHSKLKKRITMMYKSKSGVGRKFKALALVPMLGLALGAVSIPDVRAAVSTISSKTISTDKGNENPSQNNTVVKTYKVTNISNDGNITTITVNGTEVGNIISVTGGTFTNNGKKYKECAMQTTLTNGVTTIKVGFPFAGELKKASMTLQINGESIPFDLTNCKNEAIDENRGVSSILVNGKPFSVDGMKIYIDGEEVTEAQWNALNPHNIESIDVEKGVDQEDRMFVTTKKK